MYVTAIIAAGGRGSRFGASQPKQLLDIDGEPILARSVRAFATHPSVNEVIVALPDDVLAHPPSYLRADRVRLVAGGARRQDSVTQGFNAASGESDVIVIHDAARPFASAELIARTIAAAAESGAAVAALASRDTVKLVSPASAAKAGRHVQETLPRESIYLAQTPQAFRRNVLSDALAFTDDATDEAALAERAGYYVTIVEGEASNIKITTPEDLAMAETIARKGKQARTGRAGIGYDLHRLVEGRPLILAGVKMDFDRGPIGHSDADVVCHSVTDAILGALSLGDIGQYFPDTDPKWKDANSMELLAQAASMVREQGYEIGNIDVTVVIERPKIRPHVDTMRANLARALGVDVSRVSVKGKTNEGVDAVGRGEAVAAHVVALVRAR